MNLPELLILLGFHDAMDPGDANITFAPGKRGGPSTRLDQAAGDSPEPSMTP